MSIVPVDDAAAVRRALLPVGGIRNTSLVVDRSLDLAPLALWMSRAVEGVGLFNEAVQMKTSPTLAIWILPSRPSRSVGACTERYGLRPLVVLDQLPFVFTPVPTVMAMPT